MRVFGMNSPSFDRIVRSCVSAPGALLAGLLALFVAQGAVAFDLNNVLRGVTQNAGKLWEQRDALLGNISPEQERAMGEAASAVLLGAAPPLKDRKVQSYVNRVGLWLALQTERADATWRFAVLDDNTINAFAAPGGYVYVSRGLLMSLRNEAELAGVLGHEIAHVLARHHVEAMVSKARTGALLDIAKDASGRDGLLPDALLSASKSLYSSGLDQSDEFEADLMGVVIAARAGYDPYGLIHTLMTLEGASGDTEMLGLMLSTHPPFEQRLERLHGAMAGPLGEVEGKSPDSLLKAMQARLR